jgi:hypothetical protein
MKYDVIGDVHGEFDRLVELLTELGYSHNGTYYSHASRQVLFIGDLIDRSPQQRQVVELVRAMHSHGQAVVLMGNHEYNAIAYATQNPQGDYLRRHSAKNKRQHAAFLNEYEFGSKEYLEVIDWFKTLPLFVETEQFCAAHACFDRALVNQLKETIPSGCMTDSFLWNSGVKGTFEYLAIERLLKGPEVKLPEDATFSDSDGNERTFMRVAWWKRSRTTYREMFLGPDVIRNQIPSLPFPNEDSPNYDETEKPLFIGHYWMNPKNGLNVLQHNVACVDFSACKGGKMVGYRFDGERTLDPRKFVAV